MFDQNTVEYILHLNRSLKEARRLYFLTGLGGPGAIPVTTATLNRKTNKMAASYDTPVHVTQDGVVLSRD